MGEQEDIVRVLMQTAGSLKEQAQILRKQSSDLMKEAGRIRAASKKARSRRSGRNGRNKKRK